MEFWKKNLYVIWGCQFLAMIGMSSIVPFLPLYVRELGVNNTDEAAIWSGLVFAVPFIFSFFLSPVWGNLGDRYGRKIMTIRAILGLALAQLLSGFVQTPLQLLIVRLFQGALSGFLPAAMALVASNTPKEKTGYALSALQASTAAGTVLGPFFGGIISDTLGYRAVFLMVSALLFVTGLLIIFFVQEKNKVDQSAQKFTLIENWKYALTNKTILYLGILICLTSLGVAFIRPIFAFYLESFDLHNTEFQATITGGIYGILGIFTTFSAVWWGKRSAKGFRANLLAASVIVGAMYVLHYFIYDIFLLIPVRALLGFAYGALQPLIFTLISDETSFERKGAMIGIATSFQILGSMIGPVISGSLAGVAGLRAPFIITGFIFFLMTYIIYKNVKR